MNRVVLKNVFSVIVGAGVGRVIDDMIDATAPDQVRIPVKVLRKIGSWSLGWFVSDCVCEKVENAFDEIAESVDKAKEVIDGEDQMDIPNADEEVAAE